MGILSRDSILSADDLPRELVAVPEWGGEVYVRALTGTERERFEGALPGDDDDAETDTLRATLAVLSVVDESGVHLFKDSDIAAVSGKNAQALQRIFDVAKRLSGIGKEAQERAEKNSGPTPGGGSSSA